MTTFCANGSIGNSYYQANQCNLIVLQKILWDKQHATRGIGGQEGCNLMYVPNNLAVELAKLLPVKSRIIEVGCANGRDARFFGLYDHQVTAIDFSRTALEQMMELAQHQKCAGRIIPLCHNIFSGLPEFPNNTFDCFYARSSLHIDDKRMFNLAHSLDDVLKPNGIIAIEGKTVGDLAVKTSEKVTRNLVINWAEEGHLRRVWTQDFCLELAKRFDWDIVTLTEVRDELFGKHFLRFIARKKST